MLAFVFEQAAKYSRKLWSCSLLTAIHPSGGNTRHLQFNVFLSEDICLSSMRLREGICQPAWGVCVHFGSCPTEDINPDMIQNTYRIQLTDYLACLGSPVPEGFFTVTCIAFFIGRSCHVVTSSLASKCCATMVCKVIESRFIKKNITYVCVGPVLL